MPGYMRFGQPLLSRPSCPLSPWEFRVFWFRWRRSPFLLRDSLLRIERYLCSYFFPALLNSTSSLRERRNPSEPVLRGSFPSCARLLPSFHAKNLLFFRSRAGSLCAPQNLGAHDYLYKIKVVHPSLLFFSVPFPPVPMPTLRASAARFPTPTAAFLHMLQGIEDFFPLLLIPSPSFFSLSYFRSRDLEPLLVPFSRLLGFLPPRLLRQVSFFQCPLLSCSLTNKEG